MSYASRLETQNDRIRVNIAARSTTLSDGKEFILEDRLWSIWMRPIGDSDSKTELDEFQECVPSPDLARNLYSAIKTISILICIHWCGWHEFAERFCRLTSCSTLDDLQDVDSRLPFTKDSLAALMFPHDSDSYATTFYAMQFLFLPLVLEENQEFTSYESEYRLPLLDEPPGSQGGLCDRIVPVRVAEGHFRFARGGVLNSTPQILRRKKLIASLAIEHQIRNLVTLRTTEDTGDRVMRHLVALKIGFEYNIFYDEAELDLDTFLNGQYNPFYADCDIAPEPLIGQAWYLAGALHFLHDRLLDRRGRILCSHRDLKPANILIVRSTGSRIGKWMVADLGISVVKIERRSGFLAADMYGEEGQTTASVTTSPRYSSDYPPPELQPRLPMIHADNDTRKGDIWSFGCILTEVLVFSLGGGSLVTKLRTINNCEDQTGPFNSAAEHEMPAIYKVKKQVKTWVRLISVHQDSWARDWFNLIFDYVLQIAPNQRHGANRIQEQLDSIWRHAPTENLWPRLPQHLDFPSHSSSWSNSPNLCPSLVSLLSSELISGHQSSTPELTPARTPNRDTNEDPLMIVRTPQDEPAPLSPRTTGSTEDTITLGSPHRLPTIETNLRDELPDADDMAICSDSTRIIFWTDRNVIPFTIMSSTFFRETNEIANVSLKTNPPAVWIDASLSGPYLALAKSSPSSMQVKVFDIDHGQIVQPSTEWPPFQGLGSLCVSSQGWLALFYDRVVRFQCTGEATHLRNSSWSTSSENICSACFSQDGSRFFGVSWTQLWIGRLEHEKWMLRASGGHHLSARNYVAFKPYLVPFTTREALFAHNPAEDNLRYLDAKSSAKVDLGPGVIRIALSKGEDMLIYVRKLRARRSRFLSQSFYGLTWRSIRKSQATAVHPGAESDTTDLNIAVEKNKKFSLTSSFEQGVNIAWVATSRGEIRKCRLM